MSDDGVSIGTNLILQNVLGGQARNGSLFKIWLTTFFIPTDCCYRGHSSSVNRMGDLHRHINRIILLGYVVLAHPLFLSSVTIFYGP